MNLTLPLFTFQVDPGIDFQDILRQASKKALSKNMITLTSEGLGFRSISSPAAISKNKGQPKLKQLKLFAGGRSN